MASGSITPSFLSGSTDGRGIAVTANSPSGADVIHTATSSASEMDFLDLWASNTSASAVVLTIQFGGVASPDDLISVSVSANSTERVVSNLPLAGGLQITVYAATVDVLSIFGSARRVEL